ncbi:MAG: hypothetical protein M1816_000191 [Peltula sp. TS41687]|nr:MAG: hypothetical protein M1816_000191 [Peltula sp. TS41687]
MKSSFEALDPSERRSSTIYNVSFFFHGRGTELQKTPEGLLRSFLHQLLERFPKALSIVVETFRSKCLKMGNPGEKWNWHPRELQDFIESCLPKILETSAIRLFVDALDECGEEVARQLVRHFARLQSSCSSAQHGLSICFSCRHYPVVGPHKCLEIFVEHENHADIKKYITEELTDVMEDSKELAELRDQIEAQSEGVFQWVVLVIPDIAWGFQEGKTLRQLQAVSRDIPQKLDDLYQDILKRLREKDKYRSMKLFQWICFAQRPLSIAELRCAMNVDADPDCHSFQQCQMLPGFIDKDEQMEKQLKVLSGGLAEIKHHKYAKSTVQLIHQSVSDYLLASGFHNFEDTMTSRDIIAGKSHIRLFRSCVVYFTMDEIRDGDEDDDDWVDLDNTVAEKQYPFLSYAGMFWPTHAQLAEKVGLLQGDLLDTLRRPSSQTLQLWASTWDPADFNLKYIPSPKSTILHVAALFELWSVVFASLDKEKRRDTDVDSTDDDGRTLLSLAAERGHEAVVKLLLERNDVRSNSKDKSGRTPLSWAAEKGHDAVVKLLLAHNVKISLDGDDGWIDVMINLADNDGRTSLSWAAERGHEAVVKLLLAYSNVDVNLKDRRGLTPLSWAANRAHEAVVKLLLASSNVDVSCRDKDWWTLLLYATERENTVMVKLLLACGDVDVNSPCPFGRTLCSAIEGGHGAVVKLLLARDDVDVNLGGDRGCTPLLLATILGREAMVELLLAHSNVNVNSRDIYGRTPLLFAANSGDTVIVKLLLAHGDVDVNVLDRSGLTPLRLAAYGKHSTIVELLLAHSGINRNSRGENGWTPLSWAAWMGHEAEFRRLLSCSSFVDVNSKDNTGGTPLLWAAYRGREAVVKLLLARNDVEADSVDNVGNTPFSLAAGKGHEAVVKLLLERKDVKTDRTNKRNGKTPLMHAAEGGHEAIVKLLLTHGDVNVYQRDFCGRTPLSYAGKNEAVVDLLVSYGALYSYPLRADDLSDSDSEETSSASDE